MFQSRFIWFDANIIDLPQLLTLPELPNIHTVFVCLALASRCLQLVVLYIPVIRAHFETKLQPKQFSVLRHFDHITKVNTQRWFHRCYRRVSERRRQWDAQKTNQNDLRASEQINTWSCFCALNCTNHRSDSKCLLSYEWPLSAELAVSFRDLFRTRWWIILIWNCRMKHSFLFTLLLCVCIYDQYFGDQFDLCLEFQYATHSQLCKLIALDGKCITLKMFQRKAQQVIRISFHPVVDQ